MFYTIFNCFNRSEVFEGTYVNIYNNSKETTCFCIRIRNLKVENEVGMRRKYILRHNKIKKISELFQINFWLTLPILLFDVAKLSIFYEQ